nr:MAG TPA: hypothetical protein [Caudoviricetes sp.]
MDMTPITPAQYPDVAPGNLRVVGYWTDGACMFRVEKAPWKALPEGHAGVVAEGVDRSWALAFLDAIEEAQGGERSNKGFQLLICGGAPAESTDAPETPEPETPALF